MLIPGLLITSTKRGNAENLKPYPHTSENGLRLGPWKTASDSALFRLALNQTCIPYRMPEFNLKATLKPLLSSTQLPSSTSSTKMHTPSPYASVHKHVHWLINNGSGRSATEKKKLPTFRGWGMHRTKHKHFTEEQTRKMKTEKIN